MLISQAVRDKIRPLVEREEKLTVRWVKGGHGALMHNPNESVRRVENSEFALHYLADAVELFELNGSRKQTPEWWGALVESDCLDLLGAAVTAFASQEDAVIKARRPVRGWTVCDVRTMVLLSYRDIVSAVLNRDEGRLHSAVLEFQLRLDPTVSRTKPSA